MMMRMMERTGLTDLDWITSFQLGERGLCSMKDKLMIILMWRNNNDEIGER
jgi:hypothetical protein